MNLHIGLVGTPELTWRRLNLLCRQLVADPSTSLWRDAQGEYADWTFPIQLAAAQVNALRIANWQRTEDGAKNRNRPEQILPPGMSADDENRQTEKFGGSHMTLDETREWLGW